MSNDIPTNVQFLFPTMILERQLPNAEALNAKLKETILKKKSEDAGIQRSNFNGWHSQNDIMNWGGDEMAQVASQATLMCNQFTYDKGLKEAEKPRYSWTMQAWANVSPAGASNQYHAHPGAYWSAVYYVDDGGEDTTGHLTFQDPRFPLNKMTMPDLLIRDHQGNVENSEISYPPTPGKLIGFPSWLTHGVKPHTGKGDRISIAMNLIPTPVIYNS